MRECPRVRLPLALAAVLLLAGCTSEDPSPTPTSSPSPDTTDVTGPVVLAPEQLGLILVDTTSEKPLVLSPTSNLGWMSPSGDVLIWEGEEDFFVLSNRTRQTVQPASEVLWSRIEDDVTGIVMRPEGALRALLTNGTEVQTFPLPTGPRPDRSWSGVSADLRVLGAEWEGATGGRGCQNALSVLDTSTGENFTSTGCHLRVARDGRVGWTQATGVWVREANGTVRDVTGTGRDVNGTFVAHENPVFTADGFVHLRLRGGGRLMGTEVVDEGGAVLARLDGANRVALLDASADGRFILLRVFSG